MSQQNVKIVKAIHDAYARGDYEGALERLDDDIEFVAPPDITGGGEAWRGREKTCEGFTTFLGTWDDYHYDVSLTPRRLPPLIMTFARKYIIAVPIAALFSAIGYGLVALSGLPIILAAAVGPALLAICLCFRPVYSWLARR